MENLGTLNDKTRLELLLNRGIPFAQRNFTAEKSPNFRAEASAYARNFVDEITAYQYVYLDASFWLEYGSFEEIVTMLPQNMDFNYFRDLDISTDQLHIRMDCRRLLYPEMHTLVKTGFRSTSFGRTGEHHLYGNLFGVGQSSPIKRDLDLLRWCYCDEPNFSQQTHDISHLCHNNWCHNWRHIVIEWNEKNKARNGCPGGPLCQHTVVKCRRPGTYSTI